MAHDKENQFCPWRQSKKDQYQVMIHRERSKHCKIMLKAIFIVFMGISYIDVLEGKSTADPHMDESTTTVLQDGNGKFLNCFLIDMKAFK